jgi:hypothetical protein
MLTVSVPGPVSKLRDTMPVASQDAWLGDTVEHPAPAIIVSPASVTTYAPVVRLTPTTSLALPEEANIRTPETTERVAGGGGSLVLAKA